MDDAFSPNEYADYWGNWCHDRVRERGPNVPMAGERMSDNDTHDGLSERIKELELEVHDAVVRAEEAEVRAASADVLVFPVVGGHPGEIDCFSDGHSHYFVPTSLLEAAKARVERAALANQDIKKVDGAIIAETMRRLAAAEAHIKELEDERNSFALMEHNDSSR